MANPAFAFIWMALLGLVLHNAQAVLKSTFLEDLCHYQNKARINLQYEPTGILMSLHQGAAPSQVFDCEVVLTPSRESSVVLSIYRYDLDPSDSLTIEDSDRFRVALEGYGNYKDEKKSFISEGKMTVRYRRNDTETSHVRRGFQFTFTAAKKEGPCYDNEFKCNNRLCILNEYVCDGHNHCGDGSDQKKCVPKKEGVSVANQPEFYIRRQNDVQVIWISIIAAAGGVVFIIVVVFIVVVVRRSKAKKQQTPPPNSGGTNPLHSVASTVPQQQPHAPTSTGTAPSAPPAPENEGFSFYNRVRRSLRGARTPKTEDVSKDVVKSEVYQVPSMYPNLDQQETGSTEGGIVNPEFKSDES